MLLSDIPASPAKPLGLRMIIESVRNYSMYMHSNTSQLALFIQRWQQRPNQFPTHVFYLEL